jgi:hypothetical protein
MLEKIFDELCELGAVRSSDEFSIKWLGKERSYMRCLRSKQREPSLNALATCAVRLLVSADRMRHGQQASTFDRSARFRSLASRCLDQILTEGSRR